MNVLTDDKKRSIVMKKKFLSLIMAMAMIVSLSVSSLAADVDYLMELPNNTVYVSTEQLPSNTQALLDILEGMTSAELSSFINTQVALLKSNQKQSRVDPVEALKLAWIAAAQVAKANGYPLAGTLIQMSVLDADYDELNGNFSTAIKASAAYRGWLQDTSDDRIVFERNQDPDLFFSLHDAGIRIGSGGSQGARIVVEDVFDFAFITEMDSIFVTLVNDWAWLCQQTGVLHPIDVSIVFNA